MPSYFRYVPQFDYVSRVVGDTNISDYERTTNLFRRAKLREDIFGNLQFFTKYDIIGDERPDNVAFKFYEDETLDWIVLLSNNILNIFDEWPKTQKGFENYLREKYSAVYQNKILRAKDIQLSLSEEEAFQETLADVHHYETIEVKNSLGVTVVPAGLNVAENYSVNFYDPTDKAQRIITGITKPVSNYEYESNIEDGKRNIFILKPRYLNVVLEDIERIMKYKEGSTQFVSETLKRGDNIRLYQ